MRTTFVILVLGTLAFEPSVVCGQSVVTKGQAKGIVTQAASAAEQLARAAKLEMQMERTPIPQKFDLLGQTMANLSLVRKVWPDDKKAVVRSGVREADLATEFNLLPKAIEILLEILPAAAKTDTEPQVEQKLGFAYEQTGNTVEGEKHLLAAEQAMHRTHPNRVESEGILSSLGMFYSRQNKPQEAIQRFREAEALSGQDVVNRMTYQLAVVRESARLGKDVAVQELARFDDLAAEAQSTSLSAADATSVSHMKNDAQRVRDKVHR
jgi:tetratricopeptide (TPR) repeat protein